MLHNVGKQQKGLWQPSATTKILVGRALGLLLKSKPGPLRLVTAGPSGRPCRQCCSPPPAASASLRRGLASPSRGAARRTRRTDGIGCSSRRPCSRAASSRTCRPRRSCADALWIPLTLCPEVPARQTRLGSPGPAAPAPCSASGSGSGSCRCRSWAAPPQGRPGCRSHRPCPRRHPARPPPGPPSSPSGPSGLAAHSVEFCQAPLPRPAGRRPRRCPRAPVRRAPAPSGSRAAGPTGSAPPSLAARGAARGRRTTPRGPRLPEA
mmetsp:Transcript_40721/g.88821  ORF Transcript_40721/g.88821 Transcript_40721/m.88821 type:complete len:265 (-) Transcript_40721:517-1311(-)